jgi:exodeoxyribonuclease-3
MPIKIATWNINSVRLRMPIVERFVNVTKPDVICLQETKCRDSEFPRSHFEKLGYPHLAINGQKGYHGVCIASRIPFKSIDRKEFCGKGDARHIAVTFSGGSVPSDLSLHNFYIPAGGDEPDVTINDKFAHKLQFLDEMELWLKEARVAAKHALLVGDLNIAPLETDVWNHKALLKVVSHTPIEIEKFARVYNAGPWIDAVRQFIPVERKLYSWWSYRSSDWSAADKGRRLDHIWASKTLLPSLEAVEIFRDARGWDKPSDHVPVVLTLA